MARTAEYLSDLEILVESSFASVDERTRVPISLYVPTGDPVVVELQPVARGKVRITDNGATLARAKSHGWIVQEESGLENAVKRLAKNVGFDIEVGELCRTITADEIPPAVLHLAELQIAIMGHLLAQSWGHRGKPFASEAKEIVQLRLTKNARNVVRFGAEIPKRYKDADLFCLVETETPNGVVAVTTNYHVVDALYVRQLYRDDPLKLFALEPERAHTSGRRHMQYRSTFAGKIFRKPEEVASWINQLTSS